MAERKPLSKKIRFEVFKRDKFTCQYCGRMSPDVILEVDHLKPVSKGGTDDILNLVTSCRDCNRGKRDRELTDNSVIKKQQKQLLELAERKEQLEMMIKWQDGLREIENLSIEAAITMFAQKTGFGVSEHGRKTLRKAIREFSLDEVLEAIEIAVDRYFDDTHESCEIAFNKILGICYTARKQKKDPSLYYANYTIKALKNKNIYANETQIRNFCKGCVHNDDDFESVRAAINKSRNWTQFKMNICKVFAKQEES